MDCLWLKKSQSLTKGINVINNLEETKFEQFLRRIVAKLTNQETQIFTEDEIQKLEKIFKVDGETLQLAVKTLIYLFKRILKFIFMPVHLKSDLIKIGFKDEKADVIVKIWSAETKTTLDEMGKDIIEDSDSIDFNWKLNAEVSSDYHKKSKTLKAYLSLNSDKSNMEIELTHPELYSMFLQFEAIQNELDNLN